MRRAVLLGLIVSLLLLTTGCWNAVELDQLGFVQGVALDESDDGQVELTVQLYKPVTETSKNSQGERGETIEVKTRDSSVFEAIRDITVHLGRKAQWSHMRLLIVGEKMARKYNMGDLLDIFVRDHEPRPTIYVSIGHDKGSSYLESKPFLESSMGLQLRKTEKMSYINSGKTMVTSLIDLALQLDAESGIAMLPFIYFDPRNAPSGAVVTGLAVLKEGLMVLNVPSKKIEGLLMLIGKYKGGVIQVPCPGKGKGSLKEAIEVDQVKTKTKVNMQGNRISVDININVDGYAGELSCSSLLHSDQVKQFNERAAQTLERSLRDNIAYFQQKKLDVYGIGNRIYRDDPGKWERLKKDWNQTFADIPIQVKVKVNVYNNGVEIGKPFSK